MKKLTREYYFCNQLIAENKKRMYNFLIGCAGLDIYDTVSKLYVFQKKQSDLALNQTRVQLILSYKLSVERVALLRDFAITEMTRDELATKYGCSVKSLNNALKYISNLFIGWYNFLKGEVDGRKRKI